MNLEALEKDICYVIKEEQIKLGFRKESISLYYPLSSLNSILETECFTEEGGHLIYHRFSKNAYKDTFNR